VETQFICNKEEKELDIKQGYSIWVDLVDPTKAEIQRIQEFFSLDAKAVEAILNKSKKPQVRILEDHTFTIILGIKYKDLRTLITDGIYLFLGKGWLITIHSSDVDLKSNVHRLEEKNKKVMAAPIDALYYSMISDFVDRYEQLLTAIELTKTNFEQRTLYRPTKKMLEYLDTLSRQIIVLRRHFWHIRDILNFLIHMEKEQSKREGEVKYIEMTYDNITQLIQLVESYRDTINSTRDLYMANMSLQMNVTMRILAIFSAIVLPLTFISGVYGMNGLDLNNINSLP
jgi:magnesium transporter